MGKKGIEVEKGYKCILNLKSTSMSLLGILSLACVIITVIRSTIITWGGEYLGNIGHVLPEAIDYTFYSNIALLLGVLVAGICSDKFFTNKGWNVGFLFYFGTIFILLSFWIMPLWYPYLLLGAYFFSFGAQVLIFISAIELAQRKIRGTVVAFFIVLSYIAKVFSHIVIGYGVQLMGWSYFFIVLVGGAFLLMFLFRCCSDQKIKPLDCGD